MQTTVAPGNQRDRRAADTKVLGNLSMRQVAFFQQAIDFLDQRRWKHGGGWGLGTRGWGNGVVGVLGLKSKVQCLTTYDL